MGASLTRTLRENLRYWLTIAAIPDAVLGAPLLHREFDSRGDWRMRRACIMMEPGGAILPSLQIRELPQDVYDALASRARAERRSLAQQAIVELRRMPELVARERRRGALEEIRANWKRRSAAPSASPTDLIREDRGR